MRRLLHSTDPHSVSRARLSITRRRAARESAEIEKVPNSEEVRTAVSGYGVVFIPAQSTEAIANHFVDLGAKAQDDE